MDKVIHNVEYDQDKYWATNAARDIARSGDYSVNGCGASGSKRWQVWLLTNLFGLNLYSVCFWHDLEFAVEEKSRDHFNLANDYLDLNLRLKIEEYRRNPDLLKGKWRPWLYRNFKSYNKLLNWVFDHIPNLYHAAVVVGGEAAYFGSDK